MSKRVTDLSLSLSRGLPRRIVLRRVSASERPDLRSACDSIPAYRAPFVPECSSASIIKKRKSPTDRRKRMLLAADTHHGRQRRLSNLEVVPAYEASSATPRGSSGPRVARAASEMYIGDELSINTGIPRLAGPSAWENLGSTSNSGGPRH